MPLKDDIDLRHQYKLPGRGYKPVEFQQSVLPGDVQKPVSELGWYDRLLAELRVDAPRNARVPAGWQHIFEVLLRQLVDCVPTWDRRVASIYIQDRVLVVKLMPGAPREARLRVDHALSACYHTCCRCGAATAGMHFRGTKVARVETTCEPCHKSLCRDDPEGRHAAG